MVRRARELGVPREMSETPLEYQVSLNKTWDELDEPIDQLTARFLQARYNAAPIEKSDELSARSAWDQIKRYLKRQQRARRSPHEGDTGEQALSIREE